MVTATLKRIESSDQGTFGKLVVGDLTFFSGELPWRENKPDVSCIPTGLYECKWTYSNRFKRFMYVIVFVPERAGVRFHSANLMGGEGYRAQLNGCVALGEKLGHMDKQKALLLSAPAIRRFETYLNQKPFKLVIK